MFTLGTIQVVYAAQFFCSSGNVTCLIAAINSANGTPGNHIINLKPGSYTLRAVDTAGFGGIGLPVVTSSIRIQLLQTTLPPSSSETQMRRCFAFFMSLPAAS